MASHGNGFESIKLGDINGDGILDIVAGANVGRGGDSELLVHLGNGDDSFGVRSMIETGNATSAVKELI